MASVVVSRLIDAPAARVWAMVSNWGGTHEWIPGVGPVTVAGSGIGSTRSAELDPVTGFPGRITERLEAFDDTAMHFRYCVIGASPIPIRDYVAEMRVIDRGANTAEVIWSSTWQPSGALGEAELKAAFEGLYAISLDNVAAAVSG